MFRLIWFASSVMEYPDRLQTAQAMKLELARLSKKQFRELVEGTKEFTELLQAESDKRTSTGVEPEEYVQELPDGIFREPYE